MDPVTMTPIPVAVAEMTKIPVIGDADRQLLLRRLPEVGVLISMIDVVPRGRKLYLGTTGVLPLQVLSHDAPSTYCFYYQPIEGGAYVIFLDEKSTITPANALHGSEALADFKQALSSGASPQETALNVFGNRELTSIPEIVLGAGLILAAMMDMRDS